MEKLFSAAIGERVRQVRMERGMSLEALGRKSGASWQDIRSYEEGDMVMPTATVMKMAEALEVEFSELLPVTFWRRLRTEGQEMNHVQQREPEAA